MTLCPPISPSVVAEQLKEMLDPLQAGGMG